MRGERHVYPSLEEVSRKLATALADIVKGVVRESGKCAFAFSGGGTPELLYHILGSDYRETIPWEKVHFYWGDDRFVPHDAEESNFRLVKTTILDEVDVPDEHVHPFHTLADSPEEAAREYEVEMMETLEGDPPVLDIALMGLGNDGHTASLFPGSQALEVGDRLVVPTTAPDPPRQRLTMTYPVFNAAYHVIFLVAGRRKAEVVKEVLTGDVSKERYPAVGIDPVQGMPEWWMDEAAASLL